MPWITTDLVLIALAAMVSPTTLSPCVFALVVGDRPRRTGAWFYAGALSATLAVGVVAAFVIGDVAASSEPAAPRTRVAIVGAGVMVVVARDASRRTLESVRGRLERHARTVAAIIVLLLAAALLRNGIAGLIG
ncbi:GAP family protein [Capillimicrobium parvum]|uniref:Uncharacterized protein n=1 Tax=Capillimicrobium parvum TaxID=2884022 RepID=A0A9E6Y0G9_9ACTN|nr:GAP family protein [Capillimicrobium parvum]UGS37789.1 hypothetical protein DSM104329_04210 [Capillimicrobium parvum]